MMRTITSHAGSQMRTHGTVLFPKCPVCGQANITIQKPGRFSRSRRKINPCPKCAAQFVAEGSNRFQLIFCEPQKLVERHSCKDRIFNGCYLDATLSGEDWRRIAEGEELDTFSKFQDISARFSRGLLPIYSLEDLPFDLVKDETIHHVSCPVYIDDQKPARNKTSDGGTLFLTNRRIALIHPSGTFNIELEEIENVEESPPGFFVKKKASFEPCFFFPPPYDPLLAAVKGAIYNLRKKS